MIDGYGVYGNYLHYGLVIFFGGSAFIIFLYLYKRGKLDMDEEPKYQMMEDEPPIDVAEADKRHLELYGDPEIASFDSKVPLFLMLTYILLPVWGLITLYYFWNGSIGWLDQGYWKELQIVANTRKEKP